MFFCQGCTFKNTYVDGIFDIRPRKGIPVKKKVTQKFSLLSLHKPYWWWTKTKIKKKKHKIVFLPLGSEMVSARGAHSQNTYVDGIFDIRPRKGIPVKKKGGPKVFTLEPS